jgi:predicted nucleotide-binding protein (sugar kinase/HSP70/actin superfamily)
MKSTSEKITSLSWSSEGECKFQVQKKVILIPEMNRVGAHLFAATLRGFDLNAGALPTGEGMELGRANTSGKECYPCQITLGDILHFMAEEKKRLGREFRAGNYVYFLPKSDGPCRFGLYNNYQRIVLDTFPELRGLKIISLTTADGYSLDGMLDRERATELRKVGYFSLVVADVLERLLWRVRPYEKEAGMMDALMEKAVEHLATAFEEMAGRKPYIMVLKSLSGIIKEAKSLMKPGMPRKPRIGIVGEIFVRMHASANENLVRNLERHGAEVVNSSLTEWVNYVSYEGLREAWKNFRLSLKQLNRRGMKTCLRKMISFGVDLAYQQFRQRQVYKRTLQLVDVAKDHKISHLETILKEDDIYAFDVPTETCLSVSGILEFAKAGYDGVVNVYPFTCMPGNTTTAIIRPVLTKLGIPYLEYPCDGSFQPGREAAIRTFMYQASRHSMRAAERRHNENRASFFSHRLPNRLGTVERSS